MSGDTNWKRLERKVARKFGTERSWKDLADAHTEKYCIECKYRSALPKWLKGAYEQAEGNAKEGQVPVVVLKEKHQRGEFILLDLDDFLELTGGEKDEEDFSSS